MVHHKTWRGPWQLSFFSLLTQNLSNNNKIKIKTADLNHYVLCTLSQWILSLVQRRCFQISCFFFIMICYDNKTVKIETITCFLYVMSRPYIMIHLLLFWTSEPNGIRKQKFCVNIIEIPQLETFLLCEYNNVLRLKHL